MNFICVHHLTELARKRFPEKGVPLVWSSCINALVLDGIAKNYTATSGKS